MKRLYSCPRYPCPGNDRFPEEQRSKVAITGSKGLTTDHWQWFYMMCDRATFWLLDPVIVTWGHSDDVVDGFAMNWATNNWFTLKIYYPDARYKIPTQADEKRDGSIVAYSDYLLVFSNGRCEWSKALARRMKQAGKKVKVFEF